MSNIHEQFENQRELARMQRRHHGAETALDKAEVRHNATFDWVYNMRFLAPLGLIMCVGWIGTNPIQTWLMSVLTFVVSMSIANVIAMAWDRLVGKFKEDVFIKTQHWWFTMFGLMIAAAGATIGPGMVMAGVIQAATPFVWLRWARHVMANTDYAHLKASYNEPTAPRLYE
jgi:hypothetical protein